MNNANDLIVDPADADDFSTPVEDQMCLITAATEIAGIHVNDCYSDSRPEAIQHLRERLKNIGGGRFTLSRHTKTIIWRLLEIGVEYTRVIAFNDPTASDLLVRTHSILGMIRANEWTILSRDPCAANLRTDAQFSATAKARRDRDYAIITPLIDLGSQVFDRKVRGPLIQSISQEHDLNPGQIYRILRRWLQGGRTKNALIGRWFKRRMRTGRGSAILSIVDIKDGRRPAPVGRRRFDEGACAGGAATINSYHVHEGDKEKIINGMREFGDTRLGRHNIRRAYLLTVAHYYLPDLLGLQPGEIETKLMECPDKYGPAAYPSERQFRYWIKSNPAIVENLIRCEGEKNYNLKYRPLNSRTEERTTGPGSNMQIDPTRLDIILVHTTSRRPIGRPTVYLVVDCFSHLITGYEILIEDESYSGAAMALVATAEFKPEVGKRYGVELTEMQWPSACVPERLHADAMLASLKAHALVTGKYILDGEGLLNLTVLPAYRAELKGLVEATLGSLTKTTVIHMPGYSTGNRTRATTDPMAYASLDIFQLHKIVIQWILRTQRRVIKDYSRTEAMVRDGLVPTPLNLWNWGVSNLSGLRKRWDLDVLRTLCLPQDKARITRRGLEYKGIVYEPAAAGDVPEFKVWAVEAAVRGEWNENITFHPRSVSDLWLHHEGQLVRMKPDEKCLENGWSWFDVEADRFEADAGRLATQTANIPANAASEASQKQVVDEGERMTTHARGNVAKRRREKVDVPTERALERDRLSGRQQALTMPDLSPKAPTLMADEDQANLMKRLERIASKAPS